jgi:hypothetical protein
VVAGPVTAVEPAEPLPAPRAAAPASAAPAPPALPHVVVTESSDRLATICRDIEAAAIAQGGLSPDFARNITEKLRRAVRPNTPLYPAAIYNFIIQEATAKHDRATAGTNLAAAQAAGRLRN